LDSTFEGSKGGGGQKGREIKKRRPLKSLIRCHLFVQRMRKRWTVRSKRVWSRTSRRRRMKGRNTICRNLRLKQCPASMIVYFYMLPSWERS
jgi:hypothetical protein